MKKLLVIITLLSGWNCFTTTGQSTISGKVYWGNSDSVLTKGRVILFTLDSLSIIPMDTAEVSTKGFFFLDDLPINNYFLLARPPGSQSVKPTSHVATYYGDAFSISEADTIALTDTLNNLEIRLLPNEASRFSGEVQIAGQVETDLSRDSGRRKSADALIFVYQKDELFLKTKSDEEGQWITVLPEGEYTIEFQHPYLFYLPSGFIKLLVTYESCGFDFITTFKDSVTTVESLVFLSYCPTGTLSPIRFEIYPNPADEVLHLRHPEVLDALTYQITDLSGRVIEYGELHKDQTESVISIDRLNSGIYVLMLQNSSGRHGLRRFLVK